MGDDYSPLASVVKVRGRGNAPPDPLAAVEGFYS